MRIWNSKKFSLRSLWPRSLRGQLVVSLILLELAVLSLFALLLLRAERSELRVRTDRRMDYDGDGAITLNDYRVWAAYYKAYLQ